MKAYPFMFGKNKHLPEWEGVVLPDFITDKESRALLSEVAQGGHVTGHGEAIRARRQHSQLGVFDIIFQKRPSGLTDMHGRQADFLEGFILRHRDPAFKFSQSHLDAAHEAMTPKFELFQSARDWGSAHYRSVLELDLSKVPDTTPLKSLRDLPSAAQRQAGKAAHAGATASTERATSTRWMTPTKGVVLASVVAAVIAGAFIITAHQRRSADRAAEPAKTQR